MDATFERDLASLFAVAMPHAVASRLDNRIAAVLERRRRRAVVRSRRPGRRAGAVALLAAALVIGGANGSLQALYLTMWGPFDVPWHRGAEVNLSQTVDGYRVTLDRAYADATRLALAMSVVDERRRPGTTQLEAFGAVVSDDSGEYGGVGAVSTPDGAFAAVNVAWKTPALLPLPSGPRSFHVVLPFIQVRDDSTPPPDPDASGWNPWHRVAGPWTFDFTMNVDGGTAFTPNALAGSNGVQLTVTRLIAADGVVRIDVRVAGPQSPGLNLVGEIRHNGQVQPFVMTSIQADGTVALMTGRGMGAAAGHWAIALHAASDASGSASSNSWSVEFDAP
jgi:hypothetical protein